MAVSARKRIWGWFFFDWASQPYSTLLLTFVFAPYFAEVARAHFTAAGATPEAAAAQAQAYWSGGLTIAGLCIALLAPVLGAVADGSGNRMGWIRGFSAIYVLGALALWWTRPDGGIFWPVVFFGLGLIAMEFATIFTNALMPHLAVREELGRVSGSGFAFGYLGGLVSLAIMLLLFVEQANGKTLIGLAPGFGLLDAESREGTRLVGPFTAVWFALFMIPYALWVHDKPTGRRVAFATALGIIVKALKSVVKKRSLGAFLLGSMFYRDALNGLYTFGGVYAALVLDWSLTLVGVFGIVALISSALFSWLGGKLDKALGPKPVIVGAIFVLIGVVVIILFMNREMIFGIPLPEGSKLPDIIFFAVGVLIGGTGGALQSSSRSLMVRHADPQAPTESFGLYGLSGRATSFVAPFLIGLVTTLTGSARLGVSPLIGLFLLGLVLLVWVKPGGEKG